MATKKDAIVKYQPNIIVSDGKVFEYYDNHLYEGWVQSVEVKVDKPTLKWKGVKIPWRVYCQMYSFFKWTYDTFKGESQIRLAYNGTANEWKIVVFPQKADSGLSTKELFDHPFRAEVLAGIGNDFSLVASAHHHCAIAAFQSGTDSSDELGQNGLHLTMGNIDEKQVSLHSRMVFRGVQYDTSMEQWVEIPEINGFCGEDYELRNMIKEWHLKHPKVVAFPDRWKDMMIKDEASKIVTFNMEEWKKKHGLRSHKNFDNIGERSPVVHGYDGYDGYEDANDFTGAGADTPPIATGIQDVMTGIGLDTEEFWALIGKLNNMPEPTEAEESYIHTLFDDIEQHVALSTSRLRAIAEYID